MPDYSEIRKALAGDVDVEGSFGRFNPRIAVAIGMGEGDPPPEGSAGVVAREVGDWMLEDEPGLGKPHAVDGSSGRGAGAWVPVVEWTVEAAGSGIIELAVARAAAAVLDRLRNRRRDAAESEELQPLTLDVSRGMAAAVAANHVASTFDETEPLTVEAVEEPSSIAGVKVFDLSYVGAEPWVVLLRNDETERRYYVVVAPGGEIMGAIETNLLEFEKMFIRRPED